MKRRTGVFAAAALIALVAVITRFVTSLDVWTFRLPRIEAASIGMGQSVATPKPAPTITSDPNERATSLPRGLQPIGSATPSASRSPQAQQKSADTSTAGIPYWCFRTFYPGLPWMAIADERNAGNAAHSDTEYISKGLRSLRLDFEPIGELPALRNPMPASGRSAAAQRNVLWQAIKAAPFRGKRVVFRPTLRAMPGGGMTAFLRSWDGVTGTPQLRSDRNDPTKTPSAVWRSGLGSPHLFLTVPLDAEVIYYGIVQAGARPVWIDDVEFSIDPLLVAPDPAYTMGQNLENLPSLPIDANWVWDKPQNLDFETVYPDEGAPPPDDTPPLPC